MNEWLAKLDLGELTAHEEKTILDLARIAAHESGDRKNAPLLCYLAGRAQGDKSLDELVEIVRSTS